MESFDIDTSRIHLSYHMNNLNNSNKLELKPPARGRNDLGVTIRLHESLVIDFPGISLLKTKDSIKKLP